MNDSTKQRGKAAALWGVCAVLAIATLVAFCARDRYFVRVAGRAIEIVPFESAIGDASLFRSNADVLNDSRPSDAATVVASLKSLSTETAAVSPPETVENAGDSFAGIDAALAFLAEIDDSPLAPERVFLPKSNRFADFTGFADKIGAAFDDVPPFARSLVGKVPPFERSFADKTHLGNPLNRAVVVAPSDVAVEKPLEARVVRAASPAIWIVWALWAFCPFGTFAPETPFFTVFFEPVRRLRAVLDELGRLFGRFAQSLCAALLLLVADANRRARSAVDGVPVSVPFPLVAVETTRLLN